MNLKEVNAIQRRYKKAKSIHCLKLNKEVDIQNISKLMYNPGENTVTSGSGIICFWKDGVFAEITKAK